MPASQILAAEIKELALLFIEAFFSETLLELLEKLGIPSDETGIDQGGFRELIFGGLSDALGDRAAGVTDFESYVPEEIENFLEQLLERFREFGGSSGEKKKQIDIGTRIEGPATISAGGDECDGKNITTPGVDGRLVNGTDDRVDQ